MTRVFSDFATQLTAADHLRPTLGVATRIEELLREELAELGEQPPDLAPHEIAAHMQCELEDDHSMTYIWKGTPILYVRPEPHDEGVSWRMFTRERV